MFEYDYEEERSFLRRHRTGFFMCGVVLAGAVAVFAGQKLWKGHKGAIAPQPMVIIHLPPPEMTPTPPPLQQPTPETEQPKMVEQQPVQAEKRPVEPPKDKPPDLPGTLGTSITGAGGVDYGLSAGLGGSGGYGSGGGVGGSKYGWYASEIQDRVRDALTSDPHTRNATVNSMVARIWVDPTGRVIKARVSGGGSREFNAAVENYVLNGLQFADAPPGDMPLPIVMKIGLRRP